MTKVTSIKEYMSTGTFREYLEGLTMKGLEEELKQVRIGSQRYAQVSQRIHEIKREESYRKIRDKLIMGGTVSIEDMRSLFSHERFKRFHGMSDSDFAKMAGLGSSSTVRRFMDGKTDRFHYRTLNSIAKALGYNISVEDDKTFYVKKRA